MLSKTEQCMVSRWQKAYLWFMVLLLVIVVASATIYYTREASKNAEIALTTINMRRLEMRATDTALTAVSP